MTPETSKLHSTRLRRMILVIVSLLLPLATLFVSANTGVLNRWDDWRWLLGDAAGDSAGKVLIVDIDEHSLASYGRWPWPRERMGQLLETILTDHQASVAGVDIILSDRDESAGQGILAGLDSERVVWAHAASLGNEPAISQGVVTPAPACPRDIPWESGVKGWLGLSPAIATAGFRAGHIRPWPDDDQIVRVYMPFLSDGSRCVPALGLAMYASVMGLPPDAPLRFENGSWKWGGIPLGLENSGLMRMQWTFDSIRSVSAADVLEGNASIPPGASVIVGSTAVGIGDFVSVPGAERFAGVGVHALAYRQWLDRDFIVKPAFHFPLAYGLLFTAFWILWFASKQATIRLWLAGISLFGVWNILSFLLWDRDIYLETEPVLWALFWLPGIQGYRLWQEKKARNIIYQQFHAYLPERVLQELIDSQVDPSELAAQSREVTVLFADIQGFTSISENMEPVEAVNLLNTVMEYLSGHIADYNGTLDKFMGDSIMAFWGAPIESKNHADNAIDCAVAMIDNLKKLNDKLIALGYPPIRLGIGINSGFVAVGNMGSQTRKNYTVVGDVVNIASRLQNLCSSLKFNLLIGGDTADRSLAHNLHKLQQLEVKGKKKQVNVYCHNKFWTQSMESATETTHG